MNLIFGCGYLGRRVAAQWRAQGKPVAALTRGRASELRDIGVEPIAGDVLDPSSLRELPPADTVLYAVGMDRASGRTFREVYTEGLQNVLEALPPPRRFIYISSTSVYGQTNGEDVDESSPTQPREANGQVVLAAERLLHANLPRAIILRLAGIYGPGRMIRRAPIENGEVLTGNAEKWLNLIHVEDGAKAVLAAAELGEEGETYLVADDRPVRRREFYTFMAELLGAPTARFDGVPSSDDASDRRAVNRKMKQELGVVLCYPDYRVGLRHSF